MSLKENLLPGQEPSSSVTHSGAAMVGMSDDVRGNPEVFRKSVDELSRSSEFGADIVNDYDYCMVLPAKNGVLADKQLGYCRKLKELDLETFTFMGFNKQMVFILVRASLERLRNFADDIDFNMLLDSQVLEETCAKGNAEQNIGPFQIKHRPDISPFTPYEKIYARYSRSVNEDLYWRPEGQQHPFRESVRLKVLNLIIQSKPSENSENLKISRYLRSGWMLAYFPLHNSEVMTELRHEWLRTYAMPWEQPLFAVKEYFGEKIALYFCFMSHYTRWLCFPAVVGVPVQLYAWATGNYGNASLPVYAFVVAMWAIVMLEYWKREENMTSLKWGMVGYEDTERDRPDFKGKMIDSYIDGKKIKYFPTVERSARITLSSIAITLSILTVIGIVASIYVLRYLVFPESTAQTLASICNAVQIQITNVLYSFLANALTEFENYRTETEFEDSMITKLFSFQFINSYGSFFFLAFVADHIGHGGCGPGKNACMLNLGTNLAIIFGTRLTVGNAMELGLPYLSDRYRWIAALIRGKLNPFVAYEMNLVRPETEFLLEAYNVLPQTLADYSEVAIQFGYMAMFVTPLPIAAVFALIGNIVEVKGDAWKLLSVYQRPVLMGAEDIGTWQDIFTFLAVAAVVTNAGIATFTMTTFHDYDYVTKIWLFIAFQYVCFLSQGMIMGIIPDEPEEREIQLKRTEFLTSKIIDLVDDDEDIPIVMTDEMKDIHVEEYPSRDVFGTQGAQGDKARNSITGKQSFSGIENKQ